eukprot:GFUD01008921.1.p1 GENE.GFUD01008921.1~~GFUD01008921.1.p1  ORF type:complete len:518 (+),score=101.98 GFUD01008921.1:234-1556(+)
MDGMMKDASKMLMEKGGTNSFNPKLWYWAYQMWGDMLESVYKGVLDKEEVIKLLESQTTVDVVITFMHSGAFFAEYFDCPIIQFSPAGPVSFLMRGTGNVMNPSVQPLITAPFIEPMTFSQRIINHFIIEMWDFIVHKMGNSIHAVQKSFLGRDSEDSMKVLKKRTALVIACSHYVTHGSWPYLPNVLEVGGLQLKDPKPLPDDLQTFMDLSPGGVVFVSFGSSLKPDQMPKDKLDIFVETFRSLDMSVIWKWDAEVPNLPKNVKISSWLPQQDLLGHPNLKVFVTHGGLGSLVEAIYHKAVIVGVPLSNDQKPNLLRAERNGYARMLDWDNLTPEDLIKGIKEAMNDEHMKTSMERIHSLYVDREEKPVDKAAWWVEYVCRHKGAEMLKSEAEDIPWYQYHHVDIFVFLAVVFLCVTGVVILSCKICCWRCCAKKTKTD